MEKEQLRMFAASAWAAGGFNMSKALPVFERSVTNSGLTMPADPRQMIRKWGERMRHLGHVKAAHGKAGRKPTLTTQQVQLLVGELLGWRKAGMTAPYASIRKFMLQNPVAKKISKRYEVTVQTMTRALKAEVPSLGRAKLTVKTLLTSRLKKKRFAACKRLHRKPQKELDWVVWVDAKSLYVNVTHRHGWIDTSNTNLEELVLEHRLAGKSKSRMVHIKYYAAVNALVGAVDIIFVTGTTGLKADRGTQTYKVGLSTAYYDCPGLSTIPHSLCSSHNGLLCPFLPEPLPRYDAYDPPALSHSSSINRCIQVGPVSQVLTMHGLVSVLAAI